MSGAPGRPSVRASESAATLCLLLLGVAFVFSAWPLRWYNDDTFITLRYAMNLAEGHGVVWNTVDPEPVEGCTSPAWMVLNAGALRAALDPLLVSHVVGVAAGMLGLLLTFRAARRGMNLPVWLALGAAAFLAVGRQWTIWSVSAMETVPATVLALAATLRFGRELESRAATPGISGLLFFGATLLRPEVPLLHLAAGAGLVAARPERRTSWVVLTSGATHAALLALLTAWRLVYFGRPLPNTFYAKVGGLQFPEGLRYLGQFLWQTHAWLWLPLLVIGVVAGARVRPLTAALAAQALALAAWVVAIGGDAWEFRFFVPVLPAIAVLTTAGIGRLSLLVRRGTVLAAALALAVVASQAATRLVPFRGFGAVATAHGMKGQADEMLRQGRILAPCLGPEDRIAIGWAGALPYVTRAWHLDVWGLNDPKIAARPFNRNEVLYHQRHATWDDIAERNVMFADIYNDFLFRRPYLPPQVPQPVMPWARDGVLVYCVEIPWAGEDRFWIFASPRPQEEVTEWVRSKGLTLRYAAPLRLRD